MGVFVRDIFLDQVSKGGLPSRPQTQLALAPRSLHPLVLR